MKLIDKVQEEALLTEAFFAKLNWDQLQQVAEELGEKLAANEPGGFWDDVADVMTGWAHTQIPHWMCRGLVAKMHAAF